MHVFPSNMYTNRLRYPTYKNDMSTYTHTGTIIHTHTHIYIYMYVIYSVEALKNVSVIQKSI